MKTKYIIFIFSGLLVLFFFSIFNPLLLISDTILTGGDSISWHHQAAYMKHELIPNLRLFGWDMGNFFGYANFQNYFIPPFLFSVILSLFMPLTIAVKITTFMPILLMPLASYKLACDIGLKFYSKIMAVAVSIIFLFNPYYSMFGGNILSTFAGEFCYAYAFVFFILYLGRLYKDITEKKHVMGNGLILALIGLSHAFVFFITLLIPVFFILEKRDDKKEFCGTAVYLFKIYLFAFLIMAFWLIPLLATREFSTSIKMTWSYFRTFSLNEMKTLLVDMFVPSVALVFTGLIFLVIKKYRKGLSVRILKLLMFCVLISIILSLNGYIIGIPEVRFIPFFIFAGLMIFVVLFDHFYSAKFPISKDRVDFISFFPVAVITVLMLWMASYWSGEQHESWYNWNYSGWEAKTGWSDWKKVSDHLKGDLSSPRIAYEKSQLFNNILGSPRAPESLNFFTGRATLEGVHYASGSMAKYMSYAQTEFSKERQMPVYFISSMPNPDAAASRFDMFNISQLILISPEMKALFAKKKDLFSLDFESGSLAVYRYNNSKNSYIEIPVLSPVVYAGPEYWKDHFYEMWRDNIHTDVNLVPKEFIDRQDLSLFKPYRVDRKDAVISEEKITDFKISFRTTKINQPHIIKIAYYPNWKSSGGEKIFPVSPEFMLIYPAREQVELVYKRSFYEYLGIVLTFIAAVVAVLGMFKFRPFVLLLDKWLNLLFSFVFRYKKVAAGILLAFLLCSTFMSMYYRDVSQRVYEKGQYYSLQGRYKEAILEYDKITSIENIYNKIDHDTVLLIFLCEGRELMRAREFDKAEKLFGVLTDKFPNWNYTHEAYYELGLIREKQHREKEAIAYFIKSIRHNSIFSNYTKYSMEALKRLKDKYYIDKLLSRQISETIAYAEHMAESGKGD
jgi:tetratricopeptide (TPR) repeat protein